MSTSQQPSYSKKRPHIVIVGGGFAGLYAAMGLRNKPVDVTIVDKRNFHLFQPLLYQVAAGGLSAGDIASPLRAILKKAKNIRTVMAEITTIDRDKSRVYWDGDGVEGLEYDYLVVATGSRYNYFGKKAEFEPLAPGLKTIEDALIIRQRVLQAFEMAERATTAEERQAWLTFVIVGAGPTGVEMAGALGELANQTLKNEFRNIDPREAKVLLVEGMDRALNVYPESLSKVALTYLDKLGVTFKPNTFVTDVKPGEITVKTGDDVSTIPAHVVVWAAGVLASPFAETIAKATDTETDRIGRLMVNEDFSLPKAPRIFVLGDLAHYAHGLERPLPGLAPVAMQQGRWIANHLLAKASGKQPVKPFKYMDKGSLAVIGRNAAVGVVGNWKLTGFFAWLVWSLIHIRYLVGFDNQILVMLQWTWNYINQNRSARLITK